MTRSGTTDPPILSHTESKDHNTGSQPVQGGADELLQSGNAPLQTGEKSHLQDAGATVVAYRGLSDSLNQPVIEMVHGSANQKSFHLVEGKLTIGRGPSNNLLLLNDDQVSRNHAEIYQYEGQYFISDLNSANGTLLDGKTVTRAGLKNGSRVTVGSSEFLFLFAEPRSQNRRTTEEVESGTMQGLGSKERVPLSTPSTAQITGRMPAPRGLSGSSLEIAYPPEDYTIAVTGSGVRLEPATAQQPTIEVIKGTGSQKIVNLGKDKLRIGRAIFNDLVLKDQQVSRSHAEIHFDGGHYIIADLQSKNGVIINGEPVYRAVLKSGDRIRMAESELLFTQMDPDISLNDKVAFMEKSDLLSLLDREAKELLAKSLTIRFFPKDTVVVRQNTFSESMYYLYSGSVRVVELNDEGGERIIDEIKQGDYFGERALLAGESGSYSMVADSDLRLLELHKNQLNSLLQKKPELSQAFYQMILTKLRSAPSAPEIKTGRQDSILNIGTSTDVEIVGEDKKIKEAAKKIEKLSKEEKPVLIIGQRGVGKRTYARYYHKVSAYSKHLYVEVSTANTEEGQVGSAIFGIEAKPEAPHISGRIGYLEMIGPGTLAIVHAELLDAHQQYNLATYLQYGWFHREYGQTSVKSKAKIILVAVGTEADIMALLIPELRELIKGNVISIPPLSLRLKDIPVLAEYHLKAIAKKIGKHSVQLSRDAINKLVSYPWPGNVEELQNVIHRAAIVAPDGANISGDLVFVIPPEKEVHKINILRNEGIRNFFRSPLMPAVFMWFNILMVLVMAGFTLIGGPTPADNPLASPGNPLHQRTTNPGMLITWWIWFPVLPISAFLLGRIWCGICPIAGIGGLFAKIKQFNLPVPKLLKKMDFWMVVASFIFLDFTEEFFSVPKVPWATGMLLVAIISLSAIFCILFERKTFCRYICPLAGMLGAYSTMSIIEVRGNKKVCQTQCGQHSCFKGTPQAPGCPMFAYPASLTTNAQCMMCFNCTKSCDNRGVQVNIRPPLQELWRQEQPILSLSLFGVMMVGLMARHQFTNLAVYVTFQQTYKLQDVSMHTLFYFLFLICAVALFTISSILSASASQEKLKDNMAHYGMAFIPLALSGHIGHIAHELLGDGVYDLLRYPIMLYHSFANGIPIGTQVPVIAPFIHEQVISFVKFLIILGGAAGSLVTIVMIARKASERAVLSRILPHLVLLMFFCTIYFQIFVSGDPKEMLSSDSPATDIQASSAVQTKAVDSSVKSAAGPITAGTSAQGQVAPGPVNITFSLTTPNIRSATSARLTSTSVASWLKSATIIPGTGQYRLKIQGQAPGTPKGAEVRAILDLPTSQQVQFRSIPDTGGNFAGEISISGNDQSIPLLLQVIDPVKNMVLATHKVVLN